MTTLLIIEGIWLFALGSALVYLLLRRTVAGGLSGAFIVLLGLGVWYGWRGASYLWALQWVVYATGILLLWAWLALGGSSESTSFAPSFQPALLAVAFVLWASAEMLANSSVIFSLPSVLPTLSDIGMLLTHKWAGLFVWLSVFLPFTWLLLILSWKSARP